MPAKSFFLSMTLAALAAAAAAQTETGTTATGPVSTAGRDSVSMPQYPAHSAGTYNATRDLRLTPPSLTEPSRPGVYGALQAPYTPTLQAAIRPIPGYQPAAAFSLWQGATLSAAAYRQTMPGLMNTATGTLVFRQDLGRLHFTAAGIANKYWIPGMSQLKTQFGFGGTAAYDLSPTLTLHAFGYYYATNPRTNAAMSPYMNTSSLGGYMDVRLGDRVGTYVGVKHYLNPMSGRWTTEPITTPYIKIGKKSRLEFPVGNLLKTAIWGNRDNPLNWQPRPIPPRR